MKTVISLWDGDDELLKDQNLLHIHFFKEKDSHTNKQKNEMLVHGLTFLQESR